MVKPAWVLGKALRLDGGFASRDEAKRRGVKVFIKVRSPASPLDPVLIGPKDGQDF